jgi:prolyl-tRNA synthetase
VFNIQFQTKEGKLEYGYQTSWGVTTRLIGAVVMVHGDGRGLVVPPRIAPIQAVILPIAAHKGGVTEACRDVADTLKTAGVRIHLDDRDTVSPGYKFNEWELKGVPLRLEIGPRDLENGVTTIMRRDTLEKTTLPLERLAESIPALLDDIHMGMLRKAEDYLAAHTYDVHTLEEMEERLDNGKGYVRAMWCGDRACEDAIKDKFSATARNIPFSDESIGDTCVCCGGKAKNLVYWARAY